MTAAPDSFRPRRTAPVGERAELIRVLRTQVRSGQYRAEPEQVAEQLVAWLAGVPA
jgi:hypothetical protein